MVKARRSLAACLLLCALLLAGCQIAWPPPPDEPRPEPVSELQADIERLEAEAADNEVTYRDVLPETRPPLLAGMMLSGFEKTGVTVAFTHHSRQSFLVHVGDVEELPLCWQIESDSRRRKCVRREPDAPRPFLVYLGAPTATRQDAAPTTEELTAFWESVDMVRWTEPPPWGRDGR